MTDSRDPELLADILRAFEGEEDSVREEHADLIERIRKAVTVTPTTSTYEATHRRVVELLIERGISATYEYPGYIAVEIDANRTATFGVNNPPYWTGYLVTADHANVLDSVWLPAIVIESTDVNLLTTSIQNAVRLRQLRAVGRCNALEEGYSGIGHQPCVRRCTKPYGHNGEHVWSSWCLQ